MGFNQFGLLITIDNDSELHKNKQLACVKFKWNVIVNEQKLVWKKSQNSFY